MAKKKKGAPRHYAEWTPEYTPKTGNITAKSKRDLAAIRAQAMAETATDIDYEKITDVASFVAITYFYKLGIDWFQYVAKKLADIAAGTISGVGETFADWGQDFKTFVIGFVEHSPIEEVQVTTSLPEPIVKKIVNKKAKEYIKQLWLERDKLVILKTEMETLRTELNAIDRDIAIGKLQESNNITIQNYQNKIISLGEEKIELGKLGTTHYPYSGDLDRTWPLENIMIIVPPLLNNDGTVPQAAAYKCYIYDNFVVIYPTSERPSNEEVSRAAGEAWSHQQVIYNRKVRVIAIDEEVELIEGLILDLRNKNLTISDDYHRDLNQRIQQASDFIVEYDNQILAIDNKLDMPIDLLNKDQIRSVEREIEIAEWLFAIALAGLTKWWLIPKLR